MGGVVSIGSHPCRPGLEGSVLAREAEEAVCLVCLVWHD